MATEYDLYLKPCDDARDSFLCDVFDRLTTFSTGSASADSSTSSSCSGAGSTSPPDSGRSTPVATFQTGSPSTERQVHARRKLATWECSCDFDAASTEFLRLDDEFDAATITSNSSFADLDYESSRPQSCIDDFDKENLKFVAATNRRQSPNEVDVASRRFTITTVCIPQEPRPVARSCLLNGGMGGGAVSQSIDAAAGSALPAVDGSSSPLIHRRQLSLPANLRSLKSRRSETCLTVSRRRRFSAGVKFADEVGENLTTFAIIPSRYDENSLPKTQSAASLSRTQTSMSRCPKISHFRAMASYPPTWRTSTLDDRRQSTLNSTTDEEEDDIFDDDDEVLSVACFPPLGCYRELERVTSPPLSMQATTSSSASVSVDVPLFRLMFEQPAADPTSFRRRLDEQMICLENVKAVGGTGSTLCSIRIKTVDGGGCGRRVFARCTDDEWASYADIVAQRLVHTPSTTTSMMVKAAADHTGAADAPGLHRHARVFLARSAGNALPYETFSFAVQRPLDHVAAAETATGTGGSAAGGRRSRRAVEFALCYEVDDRRIFWDNNGGRNYRMEWIF